MKFIKLTGVDGRPVWVNIALVEMFQAAIGQPGTELYQGGAVEAGVYVKETPEKVWELIRPHEP